MRAVQVNGPFFFVRSRISLPPLLVGGPAINGGDLNFSPNLFNPPLLYDQRGPGFPRIVNGRLDIGAFESQHP
jgi:hypothetical protein